jgi:hypothetical protein
LDERQIRREKSCTRLVERYGRDAARVLRERAVVAEEYGDRSEAKTWREIADIADRINRRR